MEPLSRGQREGCPRQREQTVPSPSHLQMGCRQQQTGLEAQVWAGGQGEPWGGRSRWGEGQGLNGGTVGSEGLRLRSEILGKNHEQLE